MRLLYVDLRTVLVAPDGCITIIRNKKQDMRVSFSLSMKLRGKLTLKVSTARLCRAMVSRHFILVVRIGHATAVNKGGMMMGRKISRV